MRFSFASIVDYSCNMIDSCAPLHHTCTCTVAMAIFDCTLTYMYVGPTIDSTPRLNKLCVETKIRAL